MKKIFLSVISFFVLSFSLLFADEASSNKIITDKFSDVTEALMDVNSENTNLLLVTPDAHIGLLFPSIPVHFSAGIGLSCTLLDTSKIFDPMNDALQEMNNVLSGQFDGSQVNLDFDLPGKIPVPTTAIRARLGGIKAPFDIGLFGITTFPGLIDNIKYEDIKAGFNYTSFGADFRYCVYEGNILFPVISVGGGYIYTKESFNFSSVQNFSYNDGSSHTVKFSNDIDLAVTQHNIFGQVQASKKILIFVPYIGVRYSLAMTEGEVDWSFKTESDISERDIDRKNKVTNKKDFNFDNGIPQVYGGIGFTVGLFQLACNVQWNPQNNYVSAGINFDFKK